MFAILSKSGQAVARPASATVAFEGEQTVTTD
jgi:hypothetical protein